MDFLGALQKLLGHAIPQGKPSPPAIPQAAAHYDYQPPPGLQGFGRPGFWGRAQIGRFNNNIQPNANYNFGTNEPDYWTVPTRGGFPQASWLPDQPRPTQTQNGGAPIFQIPKAIPNTPAPRYLI